MAITRVMFSKMSVIIGIQLGGLKVFGLIYWKYSTKYNYWNNTCIKIGLQDIFLP